MRGGWLSGVFVLAGCWRPNPAFIGEPPAETTGGSGSDASAGASTHVSSGTDTTTSASAGTSSGGSTGTIEPGTSTTSTTDTTGDPVGSSGTTGELSEQQRCDMAALDPNATVLAAMVQSCSSAKWFYAAPLGMQLVPMQCPGSSALTGKIETLPMALGEAAESLTTVLLSGPPWVGSEGVIQGEYLVDLTQAVHPCFVARLDNLPMMPKQDLIAQVSLRIGDMDAVPIYPTAAMIDANMEAVPHGALAEVVVPIPQEFIGQKVTVLLLTFKQAAPENVPHAVLWEQPRLIEAGP